MAQLTVKPTPKRIMKMTKKLTGKQVKDATLLFLARRERRRVKEHRNDRQLNPYIADTYQIHGPIPPDRMVNDVADIIEKMTGVHPDDSLDRLGS